MKSQKRYQAVNLSLNLADAPLLTECNPGGSYICPSPTSKCPPGSCVGTSCVGGSSAGFNDILDARILVAETELEDLKKELLNVVAAKLKGKK